MLIIILICKKIYKNANIKSVWHTHACAGEIETTFTIPPPYINYIIYKLFKYYNNIYNMYYGEYHRNY